MKEDKFVKKWKQTKVRGFKKYIMTRALSWTLIMFPLFRVVDRYRNESDPWELSNIWWQLPMFFMSGICLALVIWIVKNYLYAKYTGEITKENHHHHHD